MLKPLLHWLRDPDNGELLFLAFLTFGGLIAPFLILAAPTLLALLGGW